MTAANTRWKPRLRIDAGAHLRVVLVEPEIPQNTGNIARLCAATGAALHLVGRLGFSLDEKAVRRAGLDYWHLVQVHTHPDFDAFLSAAGHPPLFLFTAQTHRCFVDAPFVPGAALVFGKESTGLPPALLDRYADRTFGIPTVRDSVRSLNLANAAAIAVYQCLNAVGALSACRFVPDSSQS